MERNGHNDEIEKLEITLQQMEQDLQTHYEEAGKNLLEVADQQQKEVNKLVDDMILARKQLSVAREEIECDDCLTFNPLDSRYCKRCGKKLPQLKKKENNDG